MRSSFPPGPPSQVTALDGPGEEVQEGLLAGPCQVNIRKPLSQEVSRLLRQHPGAGGLGDSFLGFTIFASSRPWELQTPALAHGFPLLPSGVSEASWAVCVLAICQASLSGQSLGFSQCFRSSAQHPSLSVTAQVPCQGPVPLLHGRVAERRLRVATQSPPRRPSRPEWW